jgi:hypothetical protein
LVSVAVTVPLRDVGTSTLINTAWAIANATSIEFTDTRVDIVTDAVGIGVSGAITSAIADDVELVSVTVTISFWDVGTATCIDGAGSVANTTGVDKAQAIFYVVTDAVVVAVFCA